MMVMYAGRLCEVADVEAVFYTPRHPYTQGLVGSLPRLDSRSKERLERIVGHPPSLIALPTGCAFYPRCPHAVLPAPCAAERPVLRLLVDDCQVACHRAEEIAAAMGDHL